MNNTELLSSRPATWGHRVPPPAGLLLLAEGRAVFELGSGLALWPLLQMAPRGDGQPVLVVPGFLAGNASTMLLRRYLRTLGYDAQGWTSGLNLGHSRKLESAMIHQVEQLSCDTQRKVSIVGWSLGGTFARLLAARRPQLVRSVITLGSPIGGGPDATNAKGFYPSPQRSSRTRFGCEKSCCTAARHAGDVDLQPNGWRSVLARQRDPGGAPIREH
jgi:pimeloyl-ACP methyl ester carboxylesterase